MYCKECGYQIEDDSKFCSKCGKSQDSVENNIRDVNTTKRHIKALETAQTLPENMPKPPPPRTQETEVLPDGKVRHYLRAEDTGIISNIYYIEKKPSKVFETIENTLVFGIPAALILATIAGLVNEASRGWEKFKIAFIGSLIIWSPFILIGFIIFWVQWRSTNKKALRKRYEKDKHFIAVVRANGMMVPPPGSKADYREAMDFVAIYEAKNPNEVEPNRLWITPSEIHYFNAQARKAGRKVFF